MLTCMLSLVRPGHTSSISFLDAPVPMNSKPKPPIAPHEFTVYLFLEPDDLCLTLLQHQIQFFLSYLFCTEKLSSLKSFFPEQIGTFVLNFACFSLLPSKAFVWFYDLIFSCGR